MDGTTAGTGADAAPRVLDLDLPPVPRAAAVARAALRDLLAGTAFEERCEDASLALSELVTNAVLHGREPLSLRAELGEALLRLEVRDSSPLGPSFSMLDATAVTGRGLLLVAALGDRWGVEPCDDGKAVWFELDLVPAQAEVDVDVDELLASWGEDVDDPAQEVVKVVLTELDVSLTARSEAHVEALLRELAIVAGSQDDAPVSVVAERVLQAAVGVEELRAEVKQQLSRALKAGQERIDVVLRITRVDADTVRDFARAVDEADRLSRRGELLTEPAERELSSARERYLQRIVAQLSV